MRIESLHIDKFGKLRSFDLAFPEGLTIVRGDNESGKTTILAFLRAMLYGLNGKSASIAQNDRRKYMPWGETSMGGQPAPDRRPQRLGDRARLWPDEEAGYAARHGPGQRRGGGAPRGGRAGPRAAGRGRGGLRRHALRLRAGEPPQRGRRGADGQDPQPRGHGLGGRGPEVRPGPPPRGEERDRAPRQGQGPARRRAAGAGRGAARAPGQRAGAAGACAPARARPGALRRPRDGCEPCDGREPQRAARAHRGKGARRPAPCGLPPPGGRAGRAHRRPGGAGPPGEGRRARPAAVRRLRAVRPSSSSSRWPSSCPRRASRAACCLRTMPLPG